MTANELRDFLIQRQVEFDEREIQSGRQFRCPAGEIFDVYDTGRVVCRGKQTELSKAVKGWKSGARIGVQPREAVPAVAVRPDRRVFIVYGHDIAARDSLELLVRRMNLEPIILQNLPAAGDTIIEKLERYLGEHGNVGFACVLLTPDDEGHKAGKQEEKKYRARQNVVLELGMVLSRLGRRRVAILIKQSVEQPSDIAGLIYIPFNERVDEVKAQLFKELKAAGYTPHVDGL